MSVSMLLRRLGWIAMLALVCRSGFGQDQGLVAYWPFDEAKGTATVESSKQTEDVIQGNFSLVSGVRGKGIKFDGFTTRITRKSDLPEIHEAVTFEAWIAPQAYPWNWNAIVEQEKRYFRAGEREHSGPACRTYAPHIQTHLLLPPRLGLRSSGRSP